MRKHIHLAPLLAALTALAVFTPARHAFAQSLTVDVWTNRGADAVYQPGDAMEVRARVNDNAFLLVYEIDSDGFVHVLFPTRGETGSAPGGETLRVPDPNGDRALVVENNTGQDYIVAIASRRPFENLPWYLRPYNAQGDAMGYVDQPQADEEGITTDGRIVGDPFVAMERIRRRVLNQPNDEASFATAYTTYYVHEQVQYPRYICNDCHRPGHWAWWDGWDPYYTQCAVVDFRINWAWAWGPGYWFGYVPYYAYAYRPGCAPQWRWSGNSWCSSWDGWNRWCQNWSGGLVRYKSPPPQGYRSPAQYGDWHRGSAQAPPGMLVRGRNYRAPLPQGGADGSLGATVTRPSRGADRQPVSRMDNADGGTVTRGMRGANPQSGPQASRMPAARGGGADRMPATRGGGADRMPATEGDNGAYARPGRQVERMPSSPWRTTEPMRQPMRMERGPAGREPASRLSSGRDVGGGVRIMPSRGGWSGRSGGAISIRPGGSSGGGAPARSGGSQIRSSGGGSPSRGSGGGGRAAPSSGGGGRATRGGR